MLSPTRSALTVINIPSRYSRSTSGWDRGDTLFQNRSNVRRAWGILIVPAAYPGEPSFTVIFVFCRLFRRSLVPKTAPGTKSLLAWNWEKSPKSGAVKRDLVTCQPRQEGATTVRYREA